MSTPEKNRRRQLHKMKSKNGNRPAMLQEIVRSFKTPLEQFEVVVNMVSDLFGIMEFIQGICDRLGLVVITTAQEREMNDRLRLAHLTKESAVREALVAMLESETVTLVQGRNMVTGDVVNQLAVTAPDWTKFRRIDKEVDQVLRDKKAKYYRNSRYQVVERDLGQFIHLSIFNIDRLPINNWRDFQRIKNEICGPQAEGVQLYPAEERLVDANNQYHIFVLKEGRFPFGNSERIVAEKAPYPNVQNPWEDDNRPTDLIHPEEILKRARETLDDQKKKAQEAKRASDSGSMPMRIEPGDPNNN